MLQQRLRHIAAEVQHQYQQQNDIQYHELDCDFVFKEPLDGFGLKGLQFYLKSRFSISWLHDEMIWCSALNYMLHSAVGCALWIGMGMDDLSQKLSKMDLDDLFRRDITDPMNVRRALDNLVKSGCTLEYCFQKPGQGVSSPAGNGSAHLVITDGILVPQLAWNHTFTMGGAIECLNFWQQRHKSFGHRSTDNGSMASTAIVPFYSMQRAGYELYLMNRIDAYMKVLAKVKKSHPRSRIQHQPLNEYCESCLWIKDWPRCWKHCLNCRVDKKPI